jgi:hypothetical protein
MFFLNFTLDIFLLWIRQRGEPSTTARLKEGLYPLKSLEKHVFLATKPSQSRWHSRLGHPSLQIMHQVLSQNKLPVPSESSNQMVCDACQMGKAHQLPYPKSSSVSSVPLELVCSDVWGPAPESVGRKKYYVSFIDDFNKFVWIYTLKNR